jgi:hypothetical protein
LTANLFPVSFSAKSVVHGAIAEGEDSLTQRSTCPLSFFSKLDVSDGANFQDCGMIALSDLDELIVLRASQAKIGRGLPSTVATGASAAIDIHF